MMYNVNEKNVIKEAFLPNPFEAYSLTLVNVIHSNHE